MPFTKEQARAELLKRGLIDSTGARVDRPAPRFTKEQASLELQKRGLLDEQGNKTPQGEETGFSNFGIIPKGTTEKIAKVFPEAESLAKGLPGPRAFESDIAEGSRRVFRNLIFGIPKFLPLMLSSIAENIPEGLKGLLTFLPHEAETIGKAADLPIGPSVETGRFDIRGFPIREHTRYKEEEVAQARQELGEDPIAPLLALLPLIKGGISGFKGAQALRKAKGQAVEKPGGAVSLPEMTVEEAAQLTKEGVLKDAEQQPIRTVDRIPNETPQAIESGSGGRAREVRADEYVETMNRVGGEHPNRHQVTFPTTEELTGHLEQGGKALISEDGKTGIVIKPDGEIGHLFNESVKSPEGAQRVVDIMNQSIEAGASWAESFDTYLPGYYGRFGFKPVAKLRFNPEFAPEGWPYDLYSKYNEGKPDILFYARDGIIRDRGQMADAVAGLTEYVTDYDAGAALAKSQGKVKGAEGAPKPVASQAELQLDFEPTPEVPALKGSDAKIGLNKSQIESIRTGLDQAELPDFEVKTILNTLNEASERGLQSSALETAASVLETARPISAHEHSGMVLKVRSLKQEYNTSIREVASLIERGEFTKAAEAQGGADALFKNIDILTEASDLAGRETARALNIRKYLVEEDAVDVASVFVEATARKGKRLTPAEETSLRLLVEKYDKALSELEALKLEHSKVLTEQAKSEAGEVSAGELRKAKITEKSEGRKATLLADRESIKKQIADLGFRVNDVTGVTSEGSFLIGKLAINYIKEGAASLEQVVNLVRADIPQLSALDVYEAMISKNPKAQAKARSQATKNVQALKTQAKLLVDIDNAQKGIFAKTKRRVQPTQEVKALRKQLRDLRRAAYEGSTLEASKLERALKTMDGLQDQLANFHRNIKRKRPVESEQLTSLREDIQTLRRQMFVEDELTNLNEQLRTGEFVTREKPPPKIKSRELERKEVELSVARRNVRNGIRDMESMTIKKALGEAANLPRALLSTLDMSGWFRQNVIPAFSHPITSAKIFPKTFSAIFSKFAADKTDFQIRNNPNSYLYEKSKLTLRELEGRPSAREESFMSALAEKIPGIGAVVKASNRNMTTMGNLFRTTLFDDFLRKNPNATHAELSAYSNFLNIATGIGDLGKFAGAANTLSTVFFSPKLAASRFQTPFETFRDWKKLPRVRKQKMRDMAGFVATGTTVIALAKLNGLEVGIDPRESDWGKISFPESNTKVDIWGGFQQPARLITRIGIAATDRAGFTGKDLTEIEKDVDPLELLLRFGTYKAAPIVSLGSELVRGKTIFGDDISALKSLARSVTPLVIQDIADAYEEGGAERAQKVAPLVLSGVGVSTFEPSESRVRRDITKLLRAGEIQKAEQLLLKYNLDHPFDRQISENFLTNPELRETERKLERDLKRKQKEAFEKARKKN